MNSQVSIPQDDLAAFCESHEITRLAVFGSVLRDDFGPDSDIDILVEFAPDRTPGLIRLESMKLEMERLLGRDVDLVTSTQVERSRNYIRRRSILDSTKVVYAA